MISADYTGQTIDLLPAPIDKCYQPTNPRHKNSWAMLHPIVLLTPKNPIRPNEMYDFCVNGYLGHGSCLADELTNPISPYQLRIIRPQLEEFFSIARLQELFSHVPCLGLRFSSDNFVQAQKIVWAKFEVSLTNILGDAVQAQIFLAELFFEIDRLVSIDNLNENTIQIPYLLSRELSAEIGLLLTDLEHRLQNPNDFDMQSTRYEFIRQSLITWLDKTKTLRWILRYYGTYQETVKIMLVQRLVMIFVKHLNQSIREIT